MNTENILKIARQVLKEKSLNEDAFDSTPNEKELAMATTQLKFIAYASNEILEYMQNNGGFPEWFQNELTAAHVAMRDLHSYIEGKRS